MKSFKRYLDEVTKKTKVVKSKDGWQVFVFSNKLKSFIPQGQPWATKVQADKDAKKF
ncbi:MAG: hypothetical protein QQN46_02080 [Nitrosopumilus sp.]